MTPSLKDIKRDGVDVKEVDSDASSSCTTSSRSSAHRHCTNGAMKSDGTTEETKRKLVNVRDKWVMVLTVIVLITGIVCLLQFQTFSKFAASRPPGSKVHNNNIQHRKTKSQTNKRHNPKKFVKKIIDEAFPDPSTTFEKDLWDVNGPPVPLPEGETMKSSKRKRKKHHKPVSAARRGPGGETEKRLPESRPFLEDAPAGKDIPGSRHAAEALQCRESVINFVINATDGKDECDGLIKAFDKTCSDAGDAPGPGRYRRWLQDNQHRKHKRTRRLWGKLFVPLSVRIRALLYQTVHLIERLARFTIGGYDDALVFFAEDEVYKRWSDAKYLVENDLDGWIQNDARLFIHEQQCALYERLDLEERMKWHRHLEELASKEAAEELALKEAAEAQKDDAESSADKAAVAETKTTAATMKLPIKSQHASEKVVNDALLLQQGEKIFKAANESIIAMEEAEKSKKSIAEATEAVNQLLNDPTSVEARTCCASILNVYHDLCSTDEEEQMSDTRLFFLVFVMALCGMVKSLIRHFKILWLPEAAGCILVGVASGYALDLVPHGDISFDGNWFLRILVPPIIFEAALSIDKRSFNRHLIPILVYAILGTLVATYLTAAVVHHGTAAFSKWCTPIPYVEALTFGALISSIDPIATLSVLSNMGMNDTDTIFVLIFGESLLNDGVAIVLFHTLVHFLDETLIIDREAIVAATVHFFVVALGSLLIGIASGMLSTVYFWTFYGCQTPMVEVLMFFCWALLPYYVCDGIGWSGIVAAVAVGFVMDLHIVGQRTPQNVPITIDEPIMEVDFSESTYNTATSFDSNEKPSDRGRRRIFNRHGHLSHEAKSHIGFVTEIVSTGMETAIFAYLGYFLFSHRYHWNVVHIVVAIFACCASRAIMIPPLSFLANWITVVQQRRVACQCSNVSTSRRAANIPAGVVIDKKMQIALWFAGLRGAMSFALVEHIPLYDSFSGEGTRLKPELKAMSSACIMFTVFVLGGHTYYMMQRLGIAPSSKRSQLGPSHEISALVRKGHETDSEEDISEINDDFDFPTPQGKARPVRRLRNITNPETLLTV